VLVKSCRVENSLGNLCAEVQREVIVEQTAGNESLHEMSRGLGVVKFANPKVFYVKNTTFSHHSIHKYTCNCPGVMTQSDGYVLINKSLTSFRGVAYELDHYLVVSKSWERLSCDKISLLRCNVYND
jgi:hypothetical protein